MSTAAPPVGRAPTARAESWPLKIVDAKELDLHDRIMFPTRIAPGQPLRSPLASVQALARYSTTINGHSLLLRAGIENLFDDVNWTIGGRDFISVSAPRTCQASVTMDF